MDITMAFMIAGFILAAYSVVGNDVIQTLGTFLTSNAERPWYVLFGFAGSILAAVMIFGWYVNNGDMAYGRLEKFPLPEDFAWWYVIPPIVLLLITRIGIPVSTTFLILSIFGSGKVMGQVILKSVTGYAVAFGAAAVIYALIARSVEKRFIDTNDKAPNPVWIGLQWLSTGFLWSQWLIQDLANIYVFLPRQLSAAEMLLSLGVILGLLAYIFYVSGGAIQKIVNTKTNTADIRAATIVDFIYGIVLLIFKEWSNLPMSTTWVFIGLLTGREYAINYLLNKDKLPMVNRMALIDLGKTVLGLVISILLVILIKTLNGEPIMWT
ncbi:MAG: hypothetical protein AAF824_18790 [Bacteroidota bacterium]